MIGDKKRAKTSLLSPNLGSAFGGGPVLGTGRGAGVSPSAACSRYQAAGTRGGSEPHKSHLGLVSRSGGSRQELCSPRSFLISELLCLRPLGSARGGVGGVRPPSLSLPFLFLPYLCRPQAGCSQGSASKPPLRKLPQAANLQITWVFCIFYFSPWGKKIKWFCFQWSGRR